MSFRKFMQSLGKEKRVRVGKVDPEYDARLNALHEEHHTGMDALREKHVAEHRRIEAEVETFIKKVKSEHGLVCEKFKMGNRLIWESIFDDLGVPESERGKEHVTDGSGIIYRVDPVSTFGESTEEEMEDAPIQ